MKIKEIVSQHRRDFRAIYVCEHCGYEMEDSGYDDAFFHTKVIPDKVCPSAGKKPRRITGRLLQNIRKDSRFERSLNERNCD